MKKKTISERYENWCAASDVRFTDDGHAAYRAGWRAKRKLMKEELDAKNSQVEALKDTILKLVVAIEGYARENNELEALLKAADVDKWEYSDWKFIEKGDVVKFVYGEASLGIWKKVPNEN